MIIQNKGRLLSTIIVVTMISISLGVNSQNIDKRYMTGEDVIAENVLANFELYGSFTNNYISLSKAYSKGFTELFNTDANFYNPFSDQYVTPEDYVTYIADHFSQGLYFENKITEPPRVVRSDQNVVFKYFSEIHAFGYEKTGNKKEVSALVEIEIIIDKETNNSLITNVKKSSMAFIEQVQVKLIDLLDESTFPEGLRIQLMIHDSIFQLVECDEKGNATFVGLPWRSRYFIQLEKNNQYLSRPIEFKPQNHLYQAIQFLPVSRMSNDRLQINFQHSFTFNKISYESPALNGQHNLNVVEGNGGSYIFSGGLSKKIYHNNGFSIWIELMSVLSLEKNKLSNKDFYHAFDHVDVDEDTYTFNLTATDLNYKEQFQTFSFPVNLTFQRHMESKWLNLVEVGVGIQGNIPLSYHAIMEANFTTIGIYNTYNLILRDLPQYNFLTNKQIGFEESNISFKPFMSFHGFVGMGVRIPGINGVLYSRLKYEWNLRKIQSHEIRSIVTEDLVRFNVFPAFMHKEVVQRVALEIGIRVPIFKN